MEWAVFIKDFKDDKGNILFRKNLKYAIQYGNKEYILVSNIPNDENFNVVTRFNTNYVKDIFYIVN
ncbi:hypothetical protein ACTFJW_02615 [Clostridium cagae]|uniref:hypothetical protein n=1 Tax=Clostridium cagae TaxID=2080751 RepID=UPI003F77008B